MRYFLRKTYGSWSGGTQIEIVDTASEQGKILVRILAGDKPLIEISNDDVVTRGERKPPKVVKEEV